MLVLVLPGYFDLLAQQGRVTRGTRVYPNPKTLFFALRRALNRGYSRGCGRAGVCGRGCAGGCAVECGHG